MRNSECGIEREEENDNNRKLAAFLGVDKKDFTIPPVTREEKTEAQALYTAIMTDTLIEEDTANE